MNKKIDIAGIQLDNYSVREAIQLSEKLLASKEFNTIGEVDMETMKSLEGHASLKDILEKMDVTVISDVGLLKALGHVPMQRRHEIEDNDFFYELMKRVERENKSVYIITSGEDRLNVIGDYLSSEFSNINVLGVCILEDFVNFSDELINEINSMGVDVVMSVMPSPAQELFLEKYRGMLLTGLWYGAGFDNFTSKRKGLFSSIKRMVDVRRLTAHINNRNKG